MSTVSKIADNAKLFSRPALSSTFRSSGATASLYAPILSVQKYSSTNKIPKSNSTFKIRAVAQERYEEVQVSIISLSNGTNAFQYRKPVTFDLIVNDANGELTLYGKCAYGGTYLIAFIDTLGLKYDVNKKEG
jgi:hypothetical protein